MIKFKTIANITIQHSLLYYFTNANFIAKEWFSTNEFLDGVD